MNALVEQTSFGVTTSSRTVAEVFVKEHKDVLRSIDELISKRPDQCGRNFARTSVDVPMPKGGMRQVRAFEMSRDGFTLLAMGFTGEEALDWKLAYLDAFNRMEEELARRAAAGDDGEADEAAGPVVMLPLHEIARGMAVVGEYRRMFGLAAARWMVGQLGLPLPPDDIAGLLPHGSGRAAISMAITPQSVLDWVEEAAVRDADAKSQASELYRNYQDWCAEARRPAETQKSFGGALARLGFMKFKANSGNIWRRGIRLLD